MLHHLTFAFVSLFAQDGAPAPAPAAPPAAPKPQVKPAPQVKAATGAAKTVKKEKKALVVPSPKAKENEIPSYRVSVRMPGNRRFTGVVTRDKLFDDLVRLNAHNTQEVYRRHENFTLRFVDGVDGDVTLRWNQVLKVDIREILSASGLRTIEEEYHRLMIVKKEQEASEAAKRELEEAKERLLREAGKTGNGEKKEKEEELPPLLAEFRPADGWSTKRKEQIEWRRTVVGTGPDQAEQRFLDVYPQWLESFNAWQASHAPKPEGEKGDPAKDDAKKDDAKKDGAKPEEVKKGEGTPEEPKKDAPKKDETKKDDAPKEPTPAPAPKDGGGGAAR